MDRVYQNWYGYVGADPVNFIDFLGLDQNGVDAVSSAGISLHEPEQQSQTFEWPVASGSITTVNGPTNPVVDPKTSLISSPNHDGIDVANSSGTPIVASTSGVVTAVTSPQSPGKSSELGYGVTIKGANGYETTYGHFKSPPLVSLGQHVDQGQQIGQMGETGLASGVHVHYQITRNGKNVDPMTVLPERPAGISVAPQYVRTNPVTGKLENVVSPPAPSTPTSPVNSGVAAVAAALKGK